MLQTDVEILKTLPYKISVQVQDSALLFLITCSYVFLSPCLALLSLLHEAPILPYVAYELDLNHFKLSFNSYPNSKNPLYFELFPHNSNVHSFKPDLLLSVNIISSINAMKLS